MESWWKSAMDAAEKAKSVAKTVSQKGIEFAEATAEEAGRKFKDLGITDTLSSTLSAPTVKQAAPTDEELTSYGITPTFIEFIRSLNYNIFRDHAPEGSGPTDAPASGDAAPDAPALNPWQVRHATLVVQAVKEVNELRYVLCPRYMDDQRFWSVYFSLATPHLPSGAATWREGDPLPPVAGIKEGDESFMSLAPLQGTLKNLGGKLQAAVSKTGISTGPAGVELASLLPAMGSGETAAPAAAASNADDGAAATPSTLLDRDPDLEAYLQVADETRDGEEGSGVEEGEEEDDLDLDQYLNELSAEVGEECGDGGGEEEGDDGVDVDAVLRELQEEDE